MVDVVKLAIERRSMLKSEVLRLEDFIRMGEYLLSVQASPGAAQGRGGRETGAGEPVRHTA